MAAGAQTASLLVLISAENHTKGAFDEIKGEQGGLGGIAKAGIMAGVAVAGGLGAIAAGSIKLASDFKSAMTQVQTQGGITSKEMEGMKQGVLDLSATYGISAKLMADSLMPIAAEGYKGAEGLKVLSTAAMGSKAYNADLMTTTLALTTAMKDYNFTGSQSQHVMDVLGTATANGRTSFQDLAGSISTVLPLAASVGVSFEGMMGAITQMTSQGISAHLATQELKFSLLALEKPGSTASKAMAEVGVSSHELNDKLRSGPQGLLSAFQEIQEHVAKKFPAGTAEYTKALAQIMGGSKGLQPILALTSAHLEDARKATAALAGASEHGGYTAQSWAAVQGDLATRIDVARTTVEKYMIMLGQKLIPIVSQLIGWFTTNLPIAIAITQKWFEQNQKTIEKVVDVIKNALITTMQIAWTVIQDGIKFLGWMKDHFDIIGPILLGLVAGFIAFKAALMIGALINTVSTAIMIMGAISEGASVGFGALTIGADGLAIGMVALSWPIIAIIAAFAAIVAITVLVITHWSQVKSVAETVFKFILSVVQNVWNWIKSNWPILLDILLGPFGFLIGFIVQNFDAIKKAISNFIGAVVDFFKALPGRIWDVLKGLGGIIGGVFTSIWDNVSKAIVWVFSLIVDYFTKLPGRLVQGLSNIASMIGGVFQGALSWVAGRLGEWGGAILQYFINLPGNFIRGLGNIGGRIWGFLSGEFAWIGTQIWNWLGTLVGFFAGLPGRIVNGLGNFANAVSGVLKSPFRILLDAVRSILHFIGTIGFDIPKVGPFGGGHFGLPDLSGLVPSLQTGGITTQAGLIYAHPQEAIIPLGSSAARALMSGTEGRSFAQQAGGGSASDKIINITLTLDGRVLARSTVKHMGNLGRLQGVPLGSNA